MGSRPVDSMASVHGVACAQHGGGQEGAEVQVVEREQQRRVQLAAPAGGVVLEALGVEAEHGRQAPDGHLLHGALPGLAPVQKRIISTFTVIIQNMLHILPDDQL